MKLLCINNKTLSREEGIIIFRQNGEGLKEGKIYTTRGKAFKDADGDLCYYIEGLGAKLCCRFTELLDERDEAERESDFAIEKLKEEFQLN